MSSKNQEAYQMCTHCPKGLLTRTPGSAARRVLEYLTYVTSEPDPKARATTIAADGVVKFGLGTGDRPPGPHANTIIPLSRDLYFS